MIYILFKQKNHHLISTTVGDIQQVDNPVYKNLVGHFRHSRPTL